MDTYLKTMIKELIYLTLFMSLAFSAISLWFLSYGYVLAFVFGLLTAMLNFIANTMVTHFIITKDKDNKRKVLNVLSFAIRTLIIGFIIVAISLYYETYILHYIFGYVSHFMVIVVYSIRTNKKSRR
ncbi:membrane protein in FoF1-type ATP synthase [Clostridium putrefaciens]|uniref:Membrane protein in FoF1-type ATP synthase n=1 Tax=Clostridium putrefaciens TaxID=99675 RepID=A0A381J6C3_9CLOT|nr:ATP synthase subunit I [Clostridium putrefaciens]SUY46675.1 membrane protein in FoF1-type ATP synthase [Clostridium putrefaciens]